MQMEAISTGIFSKNMNLIDFIQKNTKGKIKENTVLAITSKIVSIAEDRTFPKEKISKEELIKAECESYLGKLRYGGHLTINHGLIVASAGIDESNSENQEYILYPKDPFASAEKIRKALKQKLLIKNFAVIITDSRTLPLRKGVTGVALAYSGLKAVKSLIGTKDLFGRSLRVTTINVIDALASGVVFLMGEGANKCPLALIQNAPLTFTDKTDKFEIKIPMEDDLYSPLFQKEV